jgi:hypothetical protein
MLQVFELILNSPIGALIFSALRDAMYLAMIVADCEECGFNDLGKLLFGGVILAVLVGVAASLLWRRRKETESHSSFVTIRADEKQN